MSARGIYAWRFAKYIGTRIGEERRRLELSQVGLARAVGLTSGIVSRYERGENCPTVETLLQLAVVLGVEPGALLPELVEVLAIVQPKPKRKARR